jgi:hypothetical protein
LTRNVLSRGDPLARGGIPILALFVPLQKGQTGPFAIERALLGSAPICSATCYSMVLFDATRAFWEESSVNGIRRGRIKLLTGLIQGENDLDLIRTFQSVIGCVSPTTDSEELVFLGS